MKNLLCNLCTLFTYFVICLLLMTIELSTSAQSIQTARQNAKEMLRVTINDLYDNYYDPKKLKLMDLDDQVKEALRKIDKAQSLQQLWGIIAQIFIDFNEPGTVFVSPAITRLPDYGFKWSMIGDKCMVTYVRPGTYADQQGLRSGDQILAIDKIEPSRGNAWKIKYSYFMGLPKQTISVHVRTVNGSEKDIEIAQTYSNSQNGVVTVSSLNKMFSDLSNTLPNIDKSL